MATKAMVQQICRKEKKHDLARRETKTKTEKKIIGATRASKKKPQQKIGATTKKFKANLFNIEIVSPKRV